MAKSAVIGSLRVALGLDSAQFQAGLNNSKKNMESFAARVKVGLAAVAAGVTAAGAAMTATVTRMASAAAQTGDVADRLGVAVTSLQELRHAAEMSGVGVQNFDVAFRRFIRRSAEAARGTGAAKDAFTELGVSLTDTEGRMRKSEDIFNDVADAMSKVSDPANRLRLAFKMFDTDGAAMTKMLANGSEGIKQLREQAQQLGIVMDAKTVAAASRFTDTLTLLGKSAEGFRTRLFAGVIPAFEHLASRLFAVSGNAQVLDGVVIALSGAMNALARGIGFVFDNLSHLYDLLKVYVAAKVVTFTAAAAGSFVTLARTVRVAGLAMVAFTTVTRAKITAVALAAAAVAKLTGTYDDLVSYLGDISRRIMDALPESLRSGVERIGESLRGLTSDIEGVDRASSESLETYLAVQDAAAGSFKAVKEGARQLASPWAGLRGELGSTSRAFDALQSVGQTVASSLASLIGELIDGTKTLRDGLADLAKQLGNMLINQGLQALVSALTGGLGGALGGGFGTRGGFMNLLGVPGYATGTNFHPGGLARVHEVGGEILNLPRGTQVIPHDISRLMATGGRASTTINVNVTGANGDQHVIDLVQQGVRQGLAGYDRALPGRVQQINAAPRRR